MTDSRMKLMEAGFSPGDAFPSDEKLRDGESATCFLTPNVVSVRPLSKTPFCDQELKPLCPHVHQVPSESHLEGVVQTPQELWYDPPFSVPHPTLTWTKQGPKWNLLMCHPTPHCPTNAPSHRLMCATPNNTAAKLQLGRAIVSFLSRRTRHVKRWRWPNIFAHFQPFRMSQKIRSFLVICCWGCRTSPRT